MLHFQQMDLRGETFIYQIRKLCSYCKSMNESYTNTLFFFFGGGGGGM